MLDLSIISQRRSRQIPRHHLRRSSGRISRGALSRRSGAKPDANVSMDQLTPGRPAVSGQTAAASMLRIRAVMLGDRINPSALEIGTLVSSTPVAFRIHAGLVVIFRYGVVVLIGLSPSEESALIETLISRVIGELSSYEEERAQAQLCDDQSAEVILPGGRICLRDFSDDRLLLIADTLAKSTALERDERRIAAVFDVIEPFARELAEHGRTPRSRKGILELIGNALLVQQRVAGRVAIAEKPDALWEKPELERLYARLKDEYELKERLEMLERKLSAISGTANALTDIIDTRRSLRLEWVVVVLIVMEVAIGCFQIITAAH
ncbi:putative Rmd1/YagE family protein [Bradyrhizobium sp. LB7.1]